VTGIEDNDVPPTADWGAAGEFWTKGLCRTMAAVASERPTKMIMEYVESLFLNRAAPRGPDLAAGRILSPIWRRIHLLAIIGYLF
jgi:hypothetical protein